MKRETTRAAELPLPAKLLRSYLRTNLRGRTRLTFFLARRLRSLKAVPIRVAGLPPFYVDMRFGLSHDMLRGDPWPATPWESDEQAVMRRVVGRGDVALDVGANYGIHSVLLSSLVGAEGRLFMFEPNEELLPALRRTAAGLANAALFPVALTERSGASTLFVPLNHQMGSLAPDGGAQTRELSCEHRSLDELVGAGDVPRPDFIKCDVEGGELSVFRGGARTLNRRDAPVVLYEVNVWGARNFGAGVADATDFLAGLDEPRYSFFRVAAGGALERVERVDADYANVLAVPQSKLSRWPGLGSPEVAAPRG